MIICLSVLFAVLVSITIWVIAKFIQYGIFKSAFYFYVFLNQKIKSDEYIEVGKEYLDKFLDDYFRVNRNIVGVIIIAIADCIIWGCWVYLVLDYLS